MNETIMPQKTAAPCIVSLLAPSGHVKGVQQRDLVALGGSHVAGASKSFVTPNTQQTFAQAVPALAS